MQGESAEQFYVGSINANKKNGWIENLILENGKILVVKLDSGAQCNVLPLHIFN